MRVGRAYSVLVALMLVSSLIVNTHSAANSLIQNVPPVLPEASALFQPVADAGEAQQVNEGEPVELDGSGSYDLDIVDVLTYSWNQTSGPNVTLEDADTATPTFQAPLVSSNVETLTLTFELIVNDGTINSDPDFVDVVVNNVNQDPIADAGTNQTADENISVQLDGSGSNDPDNDVLAYSWDQTAGTFVALSNTTVDNPTFTSPVVGPSGEILIFELTVDDGYGGYDTASISIAVQNLNSLPVAEAGDDQIVDEGIIVILNGTASSDPDGAIASYFWNQTSGPEVTIYNSTSSTASFNAPDVGSSAELTFDLIVTDDQNDTNTDSTHVTVNDTTPPPPEYIPPTADAGDNQTVNEGDPVTLDGSASNDTDGSIVSYSWNQTGGTPVDLTDGDNVTATFTAPEVSANTTLTFELMVNDDEGESDADTVSVAVLHVNKAPTSDAGPDQADINEGTPVTLDGSGSSDPDSGDILSYLWNQTSGPVASLDDPTAMNPTFTAPSVTPAGATLIFEMTVDDGFGGNDTDTVSISIENVNVPPTANAGTNQTVNEGTLVTLNGTESTDPDGDTLTYLWNQTSGPVAALSNSTSATQTFTAPSVTPAGATLIFEMTVDDGFGGNDTVAVNIIVDNVNGLPSANAGNDRQVPEGTLVALNGTESTDPDEDPLTYLWNQTSGPAVALSNNTTAIPTFVAPNVGPAGAILKFNLTVTDTNSMSSSDIVDVMALNDNQPPTANAGTNQTVNEGTLVTLNGTESIDPDGDTLTYLWNQTSGPAAALSNSTSATPTFTAPSVTPAGATLVFELTVDDGFGGNDTQTVSISIENVNVPPTANAGTDQTVNEGANVALNGTSSTDPDSDTLTYSWLQTSGPAVTITGASTATPSFKAPNIGSTSTTVTFQLTVNDGHGGNSDTVVITINNVLGYSNSNYAPSFLATGSTRFDIADSPSLRLTQFAAAAWFKTSANYGGNAMIINKGGLGSDSPGQNMNYGIWFNDAEKLVAGFEKASNGQDIVVTSPLTYNNGQWNYAVVTFDGSTVRLYINGALIGTKSGTGPETNVIHPLTIGANANPAGNANFFIGEIDEVRVWNRAVTASEVSQQNTFGAFNTNGLVKYMNGVSVNGIPTANAGTDQTVNEGANVALNGTSSTDPDSDTLTYSWLQTSGPAVTLFNAYAVNPTFTAPSVTSAGATLFFQLTVTDSFGGASADSINVNVQNANLLPTANAGTDQTVNEGSPVDLSGSASSDLDGETLSYSWNQTSGPSVVLTGANTVAPSFTAPSVGSAGATLVFQLTVNDGNPGGTSIDTVSITVDNVNVLPNANAGTDQTVNEGSPVSLSGTGSNDTDGTIQSYSWAQTGGVTTVTLTGSNTTTPSFTAPDVGSAGDTLTFELTITDNDSGLSTDSVNVMVGNVNIPPVANASLDQVAAEGSLVTLNGTLSFDPDGSITSYLWQQTDGSPSVSITNSDSAIATFVAPYVSSEILLTFRLNVTDNDGATSSDSVIVTITNNNQAPTANASDDETATEGASVALNGTESSDDGFVASYSWSQISGPIVTLSGNNTATPTFTAPNVGHSGATLTFELTITDNYGESGTDVVVISVQDYNIAPIANAGTDQTVNEGTLVTLNGTTSTDPDEDPLTYLWNQTSGPVAALSNSTSATPTFTAPSVPPAGATLIFEMTVDDGFGGNDTDTVSISIENVNVPPTANAGTDQNVDESTNVTLAGGASDPDEGDTQTYSWYQTSGPAVPLTGANTTSPTFKAPNIGSSGSTLVFQLTVMDSYGGNGTDTVAITVNNVVGYSNNNYAPSFISTGSNNITIVDDPSLRLTQFAAAAWFKTSANYAGNAMIINKGGLGSDTPGQNMNYGIWMDLNEKMVAGFEKASNGADIVVTSTNSYNDGQWHYALVTFDGSIVRLYVDGVQIGTKSGTGPETNVVHPLRIGANSNPAGNVNYFLGEIDEVRVWNRTVTASEASQQYHGVFNPDGFTIFGTGGGLLIHMHGLGFNRAPTANAGPDQSVNEGSGVTLNGAVSSDPDGDSLSYMWSQTSGPAVTFSGRYTSIPTFTAPQVMSVGATLTFKLTVNDGHGDTDNDTVNVQIQNTNQPPVANAGLDKFVGEAVNVALNGTASSDSDGDSLSYSWNQTSGPAVSLTGANTASPTFVSPSVGPSGALMTFQLAVNDGHGSNATDSVTVTVQNSVRPVAALNANATMLFAGNAVALNASGSQGNTIASYEFEQIAGTTGNITSAGPDPSKAIFISPSSVSVEETATLKVTITDIFGETNSTTMNIQVMPGNIPPNANAGPNQSVNEKILVNLSGTSSNDPDSYPQPLTYLWQQIDTTGFAVSLSVPNSAATSFTAPTISDSSVVLIFRLTVNDGASSSTDTVDITVNNVASSTYSYSPSFVANGTNFFDTPDRPDLRLQQFTVATWMKTSFNYIADTVVVNKGGFDLESPGFNQNYGIWMDKNEKVKGGFEAADGQNYVATSPASYGNGNWHYVVVTFNGTAVKLFVDGNQVASAAAVGILPDTGGTQPLRIGANSQNTNKFFKGEIDEVRVWNRAVSSTEVSQQLNPGIFDPQGLLVYMDGIDDNNTPKANAGPDKIAIEHATVSLIGTASSDPDSGDTLTYWWTQTSGLAVSLNNANSATATFTAPEVDEVGTTLGFELKVGDGHGATNTDVMMVTVKDENQDPIASAGTDQTVDEGTNDIILNGTASSDPDADSLTYSWSQTPGPTVSLDDPNAMNPTFTAPIVAATATLSFELTVSDGIATDIDTVDITVTNTAGGYSYLPAFIATGANKYDIPHHQSLQITRFSIAAWFKTSATYTTNAMIVNKGGFGSDTSGQNMNYAVWMDPTGKIQAGFETASGTDLFVLSSTAYNDGNLHYVVVTYDGSRVQLYIDGMQVGTRNTSATPETAFQRPVRLGANSQADTYTSTIKPLRFIGDIDEVRIWDRAVSSIEVADQYFSGIIEADGLLVHMNGVSHQSLPVSNAGPNQSVDEGTPVSLNGAGSNDPDGTPLTFLWAQIAGPAVTLSSNAAMNPTFTAPIVAVNKVLTFQLTVDDGTSNMTDAVDVIVINTAGGYTYLPSRTFEVNNYIDIPDSASLNLTRFTVATWIQTSATLSTDGMIVNKGGIGIDSPGQNLNYGIWMDTAGKIRGGFEQSAGTDRFVSSPNSYNTGDLYYVVLTYNGAAVRLYIDGNQVALTSTTATPDIATSTPLRIGANALDLTRYFDGQIDEVRVWNRAITATEVSNQYVSALFNTTGQVVHVTMADAPIPDAGSIQIVKENVLTTLNGTQTSDPNGNPLAYSWTQIGGPTVSLSGANTVTPSFTVPASISGEKPLTFELRVSDGQFFSSDTITIYAIDAEITHTILSTPDYMNDVADAIKNATQFVQVAMFYVETYSGNKVLNELEAAKNRGVQVRLMLAPQTEDVYPNADTDLTARGIPYKIVPNHAKIVVIDNKTLYLGSANWNKNGLENNWELNLKTNNTDTIAEAYEYLQGLWNTGSPVVDTDPKYFERFVTGLEFYNLLLEHLNKAESIKVLMFEMTYNFNDPQAVDSKILNELKNADDRGALLQVVLDDPRYFETYGGRQFLTQQNVTHKLDDKNSGILQRMHAKAVLIDDSILFIGSQNWNDDSLDSSIEASLITRDMQTIADFQAIFDEKWTAGYFP